jgi:alpha-1,6-mannosyltransferase
MIDYFTMNKYLTTFLQHKSTPFLTFFLVLLYLIIYAAYIIIPPVRNPESITYFLAALSVHSIIAALLWNTLKTTMPSLLLLAILFFVPRIILFPMLPWLSDDVFGYLWYGHVTVHGMNPFEANADSPLYHHLRNASYNLMAYKQFPAIYPPLAELWIALGVWIGELWSDGWFAALMGWKSILFIMEIITFALIAKARTILSQSINKGVLLFALSPLPVIEIMGQAHNEGLILPLIILMAIIASRLFQTQTPMLALVIGTIIGAMAAIKIYPIVLILPLIALRTLTWRNKIIIILTAITTLIAISAPFLYKPESLQQFANVLQFYNRTYFNSPPLIIIRELLALLNIQQWWHKAPTLLTFIRLAALIALAAFWYKHSKQQHTQTLTAQFFLIALAMLLCFTILSPKVHTWYFVPILALNIITRFQSIALITTIQMASYALYLHTPPKEHHTLNFILWAIMLIPITKEFYKKWANPNGQN